MSDDKELVSKYEGKFSHEDTGCSEEVSIHRLWVCVCVCVCACVCVCVCVFACVIERERERFTSRSLSQCL
jgi:hypothetical protein